MSLRRVLDRMDDREKIITPDHTQWLALHGDDPYPEDIAWLIADFLNTKPRDRSRMFSASSAGSCLRAQELEYLGMPITDISRQVSPELMAIFRDGKWRHLKWQADLLTSKILIEVEFILRWNRKRLRGTMDGLGVVRPDHPNKKWRGKEFGFELKGVNAFQWSRYISQPLPMEGHLRQIHRYFIMSGLELFVVLYENKSTQDWFEWVIEPIPEYMEDARLEIQALNHAVDRRKLHPMLEACRQGVGKEFKQCSYGGDGGTCERATWSGLGR